jgi:hypothetical protein
MMTRRTILGAAGAAAAAGSATGAQARTLPDRLFLHHVYFWLKAPKDPGARDALIAGLRKLAMASDIIWSHIGVPSPSARGVVDDSYSVSWLATFSDRAAEERYQVDPIHLKFVEECAALWERVVVYDTEQAD